MNEKTLFIIKPDAISKRDDILEEIKTKFCITDLIDLQFDRKLTDQFYPTDVGKAYYEALVEYMQEDYCTLGLIVGDEAIRQFFNFAGTLSDRRLHFLVISKYVLIGADNIAGCIGSTGLSHVSKRSGSSMKKCSNDSVSNTVLPKFSFLEIRLIAIPFV